MQNTLTTRAWVEVDPEALRENYRAVRDAVGTGAVVIPMVKADGYGLGARRVVAALEPLQPWGFGVAAVEEGLALRAAGVALPIVVFSPMAPQAVHTAVSARLIPCISELTALRVLAAEAARAAAPVDFHVEIDTGMGRAGFDWRETPRWSAELVAACGSQLRWAGVYTHFHGADGADAKPSQVQWERFRDALAQLPVSREDLMVHACNSAAALRFPAWAADAVRPGIYLYGGRIGGAELDLVRPPRRVASVRARLVLVREVPPGSTVGYGATHVAAGWERWGTLAIGYGDGLPRALGNRGHALIGGRRVPIVGRVSMDMTVVDLTSVPEARVGDVATLIGGDGGAEITVDEVAALAGTISYEILTGLTARLPRVETGDAVGV